MSMSDSIYEHASPFWSRLTLALSSFQDLGECMVAPRVIARNTTIIVLQGDNQGVILNNEIEQRNLP
jgi:hypothetical protein